MAERLFEELGLNKREAKEVVEHTVEEGRETSRKARSELEEKLRKEREE